MTVRLCFESCLVELNKVQAPSLLLDDFNYLFNKAILKYFNKRYALFEINLQLTDDLRVLTRTVKLTPLLVERSNLMGDSYRVQLKHDYVHILNCICEFTNYKLSCDNNCTTSRYGAKKLDSNQWSSVITNYYMRPSMIQPYYYISNIEDPEEITNIDPKNKIKGERYGNSTYPILEIKCGAINPTEHSLTYVYIDYLRAPKFVLLEQDDLDRIEDNTDLLEFPDYVIYEIINELVTVCLENSKDPRLLTYPVVNTSVPQK